MRLSELPTGERAYIVKVNGSGAFRKRILEMGFVRGQEVVSILNAPLKDPVKYGIMEYEVSLRRTEADLVEISKTPLQDEYSENAESDSNTDEETMLLSEYKQGRSNMDSFASMSDTNTITVALVGNPNAGKTSIFNHASGAHEHVGNYGGVTISAKEGYMRHGKYTIKLVDLPGTYSLSAYSPEELYVRKHIFEEKPDIIINVVAASSLERNLYLTTELIDMDCPVVIALNMYDELQESGREFRHEELGRMLGIPFVPTVGKKGTGIPELLDKVIEVHEKKCDILRDNVKVPYGRVLEKSIGIMERELSAKDVESDYLPARYIAVKLLEGDENIEAHIAKYSGADEIIARRNKERDYIEKLLREDAESAFTNARYGFIAGGLRETLTEKTNISETTRHIDAIVTHRFWGFPLFFFFMWIMFEATFRLGAYPMDWIEDSVAALGDFTRQYMSDGPLKDLIVDGIIGGVGGVIVFLPNIVILYLFIAFMEDSGYMARAAFIMDKMMHRMGLHGKSFIPLIMGFGCNVPAIMSTRTIESRNSRMITMLIVPFMSCSARLPVYLLFVGAFFTRAAGTVLLGLYVTGIVIAVVSALLFRKTFFRGEDTPFVMELPPYRMPTLKSVLIHMWDRAYQYLKKMGGIILIGSIIIWFLGYFPRNKERFERMEQQVAQVESSFEQHQISEEEKTERIEEIEHTINQEHQENSYIGRIGRWMKPVMRPLGFDEKISVSLLSGLAAKEIVISSMGVIYTGDSDNQESLQTRLKQETHADGTPVFTMPVVIAFLLFTLIYFPCIATIVAIKEEANSWKWGIFSVLYSTGLAWLVAFVAYQLLRLIM